MKIKIKNRQNNSTAGTATNDVATNHVGTNDTPINTDSDIANMFFPRERSPRTDGTNAADIDTKVDYNNSAKDSDNSMSTGSFQSSNDFSNVESDAESVMEYNDADPVLPSLHADPLTRDAAKTIQSLQDAWNKKKHLEKSNLGVQIVYRSRGGHIAEWDEHDPVKVKEWKDVDLEPTVADFNDWDTYFTWLDSVGQDSRAQLNNKLLNVHNAHNAHDARDGAITGEHEENKIEEQNTRMGQMRYTLPESHAASSHTSTAIGSSIGVTEGLKPCVHVARTGSIYVTYEDSKQEYLEDDYDFTAHAHTTVPPHTLLEQVATTPASHSSASAPAPTAAAASSFLFTPTPTSTATTTANHSRVQQLWQNEEFANQDNSVVASGAHFEKGPSSSSALLVDDMMSIKESIVASEVAEEVVSVVGVQVEKLENDVRKTARELAQINEEHKHLEFLHHDAKEALVQDIAAKSALLEEHRQLIASGVDTPEIAQKERALEDQIRSIEAEVVHDVQVLQQTEAEEHRLTGAMEHLAEEIAVKRANIEDSLSIIANDKETHHHQVEEAEQEIQNLKKESAQIEELKVVEVKKIEKAKEAEAQVIHDIGMTSSTVQKQELTEHLVDIRADIQMEEQKLQVIAQSEKKIAQDLADQQKTAALERALENKEAELLHEATKVDEEAKELIVSIQSNVAADIEIESHNREAAGERSDGDGDGDGDDSANKHTWREEFERERQEYKKWIEEQKQQMEVLKSAHEEELALSEAKLITMKDQVLELEQKRKEEVKTAQHLKEHLEELAEEQSQLENEDPEGININRATILEKEVAETRAALAVEEEHIAAIDDEEQHIIDDMEKLEEVVHEIEDLETIDQAREDAMVEEEEQEQERKEIDKKLEQEVMTTKIEELSTIVQTTEIVEGINVISDEKEEPAGMETLLSPEKTTDIISHAQEIVDTAALRQQQEVQQKSLDAVEQLRLEFALERKQLELEREALRYERQTHQEQLEKEQLEKEQLEKERLEKEQLEKEQLEKEQLEKEQLMKEKASSEKTSLENVSLEKAATTSSSSHHHPTHPAAPSTSLPISESLLVRQLEQRLAEQHALAQLERDRMQRERDEHTEERERDQANLATALSKAQTQMATILREQSQVQNQFNLELHKAVLSPTAEQRMATVTYQPMLTPGRKTSLSSRVKRRRTGEARTPQHDTMTSSRQHLSRIGRNSLRDNHRHSHHTFLESSDDDEDQDHQSNDAVEQGHAQRSSSYRSPSPTSSPASPSSPATSHLSREDDMDSLDLEYERDIRTSGRHSSPVKAQTVISQQLKSRVEQLETDQLRSRLELLEGKMSTMQHTSSPVNLTMPNTAMSSIIADSKTNEQSTHAALSNEARVGDSFAAAINARMDNLEGKVSALSPIKSKLRNEKEVEEEEETAGKIVKEKHEDNETEYETAKNEDVEEDEHMLPLLRKTLMEQQAEVDHQSIYRSTRHHPAVNPLYTFETFEHSLPAMDDAQSETSLPGYSIPMHEDYTMKDDNVERQGVHGGGGGGGGTQAAMAARSSIWSGRSVLEDIIQMRVELESALKVGELTSQRAQEAEQFAAVEEESRAMMEAAELHRSEANQLEEEAHALAVEEAKAKEEEAYAFAVKKSMRTQIGRVHDEVEKFMSSIASRGERVFEGRVTDSRLHSRNVSPIPSATTAAMTAAATAAASAQQPFTVSDGTRVAEETSLKVKPEHKVRQQLSNMMGIAALRPFDTVTHSSKETNWEPTVGKSLPIFTYRSTAKLSEAAHLRREADLLFTKAQQSRLKSRQLPLPSASPSLGNAQKAVLSYARFSQSRETAQAAVLKNQDHTSKLLKLRQRIAALDRSLDRSRGT